MGGMNRGWLILHNRIVCESGPGVFMKTNSDEHLIRGNVFVIRKGKAPGLVIGTEDCDGVRFVDNRVYCAGPLVGGKGRAASTEGSRRLAPPADAAPDRPKPQVASIFEWQRRAAR